MKHVLDATAIRSGRTFTGEGFFTTPGIVEEVRLGRQGRGLDMLLGIGIKVMSPGREALELVWQKAAETNDSVSENDMGVLALAYQLGAEIISDDYAVQNLASLLGIPVQGELEGIRETINWTYRCKGCGRYFEEKPADCPVCGSDIRKVKR